MTTDTAPPAASPRRARRTAFRFVARTASGRTMRGTIRVPTRQAAWTVLAERGLEPVDIRPRQRWIREPLSRDDLLHTTRQLAVFSRAGVPVIDAIEGMVEVIGNRTLRSALEDVAVQLRAGQSLSAALRAHPRTFPPYFHAAVRAAEQTGELHTTLDRLADYLAREIENRRNITAALAYPAVIAAVAVVVVLVLTVVIMPRFEALFASLEMDLPFATWLLLTVTRGIRASWPVLAAATVVTVAAVRIAARWPAGRLFRDRLLLRLPLTGPLVRTGLVERFLRSFGAMLSGGVPLLDAMRIAVQGTSNEVYRRQFAVVEDRLRAGAGIAVPLRDTELFPVAAIQMVRAGELTGTLAEQLVTAADFYARDLEYRLRRFTSIFEPAVMVVAGLLVGFVAIALVQAIYGPLQTELLS